MKTFSAAECLGNAHIFFLLKQEGPLNIFIKEIKVVCTNSRRLTKRKTKQELMEGSLAIVTFVAR
jgi:hypothetical protein